MTNDLAIQVQGVGKKYCRSLRRTLVYGVQDVTRDLFGITSEPTELRQDEFWALDDVSFEVKCGECLGVIGANGAGKSTLLKLLNGVILPDKGRIHVHGRVGGLVELGAGFHPMLTGRENIQLNGAILGLSKKEIDDEVDAIVEFADLGKFIDSPVKYYSSGMYVRLGFAIVAHTKPDILLIDEALAVGDGAYRMKCFQHFLERKRAGLTIILISHNMIDINRLCDRVVIMANGEKIHDGDVSAGIATYEDLLSKKHDFHDQRALNAPAWIEGIELFDSQGNPRDNFETGDDLVAELTISATRAVPNARLIVHVSNPSLGILGAFASPYKEFNFDIIPPRVIIRLFIRELPLLVGGYSLGLNLYGSEIKDLFHSLTRATSFKIIGPAVETLGFGECFTIRFKHDWELVESSSATYQRAPRRKSAG